MKKSLLSFLAVALCVGLSYSQTCSPDQQYAGSPAGLYPAGPLEPSCDLSASKTIVSLTDTLVETGVSLVPQATLYITRMRINAVTGLPAGLQLGTDVMASADLDGPWGYWDNTGTVPNQTAAFGCAYVYGASGAWDAAAVSGPNNDGVHPLVFEVDAYIASADPNVLAFIGGPQWVSGIPEANGGGSFFILDTLVVPSDYADISTSISGDSNIEPGTTYTYSASEYSGVTYNWTVSNGSIVSGQGTSEIEVVWSGNGNVQVDLTDGGCQGTDNLDVTAITTGLDEIAGVNASVYPNPSDGLFNIRVASKDELQAQLFDVSGKVILSELFAGSNLYSLDLQTVRSGIYILELESESGKTFKRLVKN